MGFVNPRRDGNTFEAFRTEAAERPVSVRKSHPVGTVTTGAGTPLDLQDRIEGAHRLFLSRTHKKLLRASEIASAMEDASAPEHRAALSELQEIAHSIAGNAGSFGYQRLTEIAEKLEAAIDMERFDQDLIFDHIIAMASEFLSTGNA